MMLRLACKVMPVYLFKIYQYQETQQGFITCHHFFLHNGSINQKKMQWLHKIQAFHFYFRIGMHLFFVYFRNTSSYKEVKLHKNSSKAHQRRWKREKYSRVITTFDKITKTKILTHVFLFYCFSCFILNLRHGI